MTQLENFTTGNQYRTDFEIPISGTLTGRIDRKELIKEGSKIHPRS